MAGLLSKLIQLINPATSTKQEPTVDVKQIYNQHRHPDLHSAICFAPSVNMVFAQDGGVKACCHNSENLLGKYPEQSISQIWNSTEAKLFRQKMSSYQLLSGCGVCAADYDSHSFEEMPAKHFDSLPKLPSYPTMMEFLLSNTCNLECVMCNGELSSSIRKNRDKLPAIKSPYDAAFVEQLKEFIPYLKETRFSGAGEAFSIDMNYEIWEMLIAQNPACEIVVQTNGTILNERVKDFLARGNFRIGVSLDSLQKENYEQIRVNAKFDRVMENVAYFAAYSREKKKAFTISTCVMRQNYNELPAFVLFCNRIGAHCTFHKVWFPSAYGLYNLPAKELKVIHDGLAKANLPESTAFERKNKRHFEYYLTVIKNWEEQQLSTYSEAINLSAISVYELKTQIQENLRSYISTQSMLEQDREELANTCSVKLETVLNACSNEKEQRQILETIYSSPLDGVIPALKNNTAEKLYEMSKGYAAVNR